MKSNTHFSITQQDHQENMSTTTCSHSQAVRRVNHAFSRKTANKLANGSEQQRFMLHGGDVNMKDTVSDQPDELLVSSSGGRERLKRHREEVAGHVSIPDKWGHEEMLKDWIDCSSFEALLVPNKIASARKALVATADHGRNRAASSHQLRIESRC
ncbi:hypothetical protein Dsin_019756 [Dipteronia sinensis]|uniref:Protein BIC1-like n=1 Tax=Dipteronia sinensis TaxID=43782 RepID=A0AAE0A7W5_9ROSI|nr:hypothetical protein Dsin_019756 [Dipteronia sinensis]